MEGEEARRRESEERGAGTEIENRVKSTVVGENI